MAAPPVRITVAVPTYHRPDDLAVLLPMLAEHSREVTGTGDRWQVDVLVVDNDAGAGAAEVVRRVGGGDVRYVVEPSPGIAAARNRALDEAADSRLLVFIDDDERPLAGWLSSLVQTWEATGAAAVSGVIVADVTGDEVDPWIAAGNFFVRRSMPTGTELDVAACGNLLLDLDQLRQERLRFDASLGLAGAEDTLFSRRLARLGGRMVWCNESAALDAVPPQRMTRKWVLTRAWSNGNAHVLTDLRLAAGAVARLAVRVRGVTGGLARLVAGAVRWLWGLCSRSLWHQARGARVALRGVGMIGGALGIVFVEYGRSGRRWRFSWRGLP